MINRNDQQTKKPSSSGNPTTTRGHIRLYAIGVTFIVLLILIYHIRSWSSYTSAFDVCEQLFCDFVDYYYPMGAEIFRTGLPVDGFLYSPFIAILLAVFPLIGLNTSLILWGLLQVFFILLCILLFRRLVPAGLPVQLLFVALTLSGFPLLLNFIGGQVSIFIMVALLGMLFFYERGQYVIAGILLIFAISFKFYPIIFLAAFAVRRDTRLLLVAAIGFVVILFVVPGIFLGIGSTVDFYKALLNSFRESEWVTINPHSEFFPHLVLRMVNGLGFDAQAYLPLLYIISYGVFAANIGLLYLIQRARLQYENLWNFQILFLTIPFVLKTSWTHDFFFLPFAQALVTWQLLEGAEKVSPKDIAGKDSSSYIWSGRTPNKLKVLILMLLLMSIIFSNVVFFNLFGNFEGYGFVGFLFWSNLFLLISTYIYLIPHALRQFRKTDVAVESMP